MHAYEIYDCSTQNYYSDKKFKTQKGDLAGPGHRLDLHALINNISTCKLHTDPPLKLTARYKGK